jgi:hypothetical protein
VLEISFAVLKKILFQKKTTVPKAKNMRLQQQIDLKGVTAEGQKMPFGSRMDC